MAETKAYVLCPVGVVFDVAGFFAVWSDDGSWGPSVGCGFGLFNSGVVVGVPVGDVEWSGSVTSGGVFFDLPSGRRKVPVVGGSSWVRRKGAGSVRGNGRCTGLTNSDGKRRGRETRRRGGRRRSG